MATEATNVMAPGVGAEEVRRIGTRVGALRSGLRKDFPRWVVISYGVVAVLVAAYVISVAARGGSSGSFALDGWGVAALELLVSLLCLGRLTVAAPALRGRGVALALGAGLMSWATGDLIVAAQFGSSTPAAAQMFYLGFYPLTYMAVVLLMRQEVTRFPAPTWLDGALAGLGAAAVCAAFAFRDLLHSAGTSAFATALNVAYPIGDLLLLALVVGGTAMLPGRRRVRWLLLASACTLNAVGDTFNLLHNSVGASAVGQAFNATAWPVAILLMSIAIWMRTTPPVGADQSFSVGFVLPGLSAMAGLVILTVGSLHPVGRIALGLAATTLVVAGLRLALSVGALRSVTEQRHRQSITDELTGLGNRRHLSQVFESLISVASNLRTPQPPGGENGASAAMAVPSPGPSAARPTIAVLTTSDPEPSSTSSSNWES